MPDEISTLILKVDLQCHLCSKEIKKLLCKIQSRARIQSIIYDDEKNSVIISGHFYPDCLSNKLRCLAPKIITDIQTKPPDHDPPPPPPQRPAPKGLPEPVPEPEPEPEKAPEPVKREPEPQPTKIVMKLPDWPYPYPYPYPADPLWPAGGCCYRPCPCYEPYRGCCRCCTCGRSYNNDPSPAALPPPMPTMPAYGGGLGSSCQAESYKVVYDEEPPCAIM